MAHWGIYREEGRSATWEVAIKYFWILLDLSTLWGAVLIFLASVEETVSSVLTSLQYLLFPHMQTVVLMLAYDSAWGFSLSPGAE